MRLQHQVQQTQRTCFVIMIQLQRMCHYNIIVITHMYDFSQASSALFFVRQAMQPYQVRTASADADCTVHDHLTPYDTWPDVCLHAAADSQLG